MALQHLKPDLLQDENYANLRAFLTEHRLNPDDEPAILAAIRERGWELAISGTAGDWEIDLTEPGVDGPLQSFEVDDTDRQRALLRALDFTLRSLTTTQARELFDRDTRQMLGMPTEEFARKWDAGELDRDDPHVRFLGMLRPLGT